MPAERTSIPETEVDARMHWSVPVPILPDTDSFDLRGEACIHKVRESAQHVSKANRSALRFSEDLYCRVENSTGKLQALATEDLHVQSTASNSTRGFDDERWKPLSPKASSEPPA